MRDLKPCIHCGGPAKMLAEHWHAHPERGIVAGSCYTIGCAPCGWITESYATEALAVEAWDKWIAWFCNRGFYW